MASEISASRDKELDFRPGIQICISNCLEMHHLRKESLALHGDRVVLRKESLEYGA